MFKSSWRAIMIAFGWLFLATGIVGIFVPLLPTTPFVLLAAFFFSRGSPRLHRWLVEHPRFGHYVRDWEAEQVVPLVGKLASTVMMVPAVSYSILTRDIPWPLSVAMVITVVLVLWFLWTRPSKRTIPAATPDDEAQPPPENRNAP